MKGHGVVQILQAYLLIWIMQQAFHPVNFFNTSSELVGGVETLWLTPVQGVRHILGKFLTYLLAPRQTPSEPLA